MKTTRRNLLKVAAAGSVFAVAGVAAKTETTAHPSKALDDEDKSHGPHGVGVGTGVPAAAIAAPPQDRTEAVTFPKPGRYLVICGVRSHFVDGMFGYVNVLP